MVDETLSVTVTDIAMPGDEGLARAGDLVVFIPGAIPGDRVRIRITGREKRYAHGEIVAIEEPSPYRIEAECSHFGTCGGCTIQSMEYAKQLDVKASHLKQSLKRIGRLDVPDDVFAAVVPSPRTYWYRSKIELTFANHGNSVIAGMCGTTTKNRPAGSVTPVTHCMIFSRELKKVLTVIEDHVHAEGLSPYNEKSGKGTLRRLVLRESKSSGTVMAIVETKGDEPCGMKDLFEHLNREMPQVTSLWRAVNNRRGPYIDYGRLRHEGGMRYIEESLAGLTFRIYPASFFQPNPATAELLYGAIAQVAGTRRFGNILGLYCGMAPIELVLSDHAQKVTGLDSLRENVENARENARINNVTNCSFLAGRVEDIALDRGFKKPDLLVIDPPRNGVSPRGMELLQRLKPGMLIYVSCNPATLARDLGHIVPSGYTIQSISPFDMFPHTSHLETLVVLTRTQRHRS